ncbi:MAG: bifunctional diaminohydroxyphosphoribosylaminopyrimidine deaminase/5-amino-6-(5-phosphoribosylamino)uracil reductase RibD [Xanthomonadales bacterium]|nr:bifunctional diaminohydroxyphosphoribosylaminopyrimidine deaminase/5-amino-6-(5-phosphoribosylamino)uracil reductase RibD [Xanthomonadales bacterium]NIX13251.1 bifunctional diaminohydroxyphosphoribosylaminopyrimidine deaminase/5-amino-6-(5-phosphoribosylamino)uracil reductase RibD [Xanthomonadales bacterium]
MNFTEFDHLCMGEALRLAARGVNSTHPNPRVGCVIAKDGEIVGRGWHELAGGPHAEIAALQDAGERARGGTAYVTLEPCSYEGRTPPCTEALIAAGIERVVSATRDPNPKVDGGGIRRLGEAGIEVECGLMSRVSEELNPGFLRRMRNGRPWIRIKLAQSIDGRTALHNGQSRWISGAEARRDVQSWRARSSAVMTGIGTLLADNPSLDVRKVETRRQPLRIIVDSRWRTPADARILAAPGEVLIAGLADAECPRALRAAEVERLPLPARDGHVDLAALAEELAAREVNEIQVEAGGILSGALLEERLVDEILVYQAPVLLGSGARDAFTFGPLQDMNDRVELELMETAWVGRDQRLRFAPVYRRNT